MKKLFTLIAFLIFSYCEAQVSRGLKGDFDTENYPEISFVWNCAAPHVLEKSQFVLIEDEKKVDFDFEVLPKNNIATQKKSILFLWEDMKSHSRQTDNTRELLMDFFNKTILSSNDRFNIAVFNRKFNGEKGVLRPLLSDFVSDNDRLVRVISDYQKSNNNFKEYPKLTELYTAINEGINMLKAEPSDRVGILVVITAGLNLKAAGSTTEMGSACKSAFEAGIPVYVVKYWEPSGDSPEVNSLAESTFGKTVLLTDKKVHEVVFELQDLYKNLDSRCYGQDYKLTFTTTAKRDGKEHPIRLTINKVDQQIPKFTAPDMTFGIWVKENLLLFIGLVVLLIGLIVMAILLIVNGAKKRKKREAENNKRIKDEIDRANQERENWKRQQAAKEAQQKAAAEQKEREEEVARLLQLMQTKNMYPRLHCSVSGKSFSYYINKPITRIGRNEDNEVVLSSQTVSKYHAEIRFMGASFEVVNKSTSYKQGIVVNGQFFQKTTLRSGDVISLGEAVITFYI